MGRPRRDKNDTSDDESVSSVDSNASDVKNEIIKTLRAENEAQKQRIEELLAELSRIRETAERGEQQREKMMQMMQVMSDKITTLEKPAETMDTTPAPTSGTKRRAPEVGSSEDEAATIATPPPKKTADRQRRAPDDENSTTGESSANKSVLSVVPGAAREDQAAGPSSPPTAGPSGTQAAAPRTAAPPKIPPIILRQKDRWSEVSRELATRKVNYAKARLVSDGIQIHTSSPDDYRGIVRFLSTAGLQYHTYALPEERQLRVVIRGLPDGVSTSDIKDDLVLQGYKIEAVSRMTSRRTKQAMPLVLVKLPLNQEGILEVTRCCSLVVRVEKQHEATQTTQCFRCQRFGHAQSRCTAQPKCVKCGLAHHSHECKKARDVPARCANCEGGHPASYRGCPRCPKPAPAKKSPTVGAQRTATRQPAATRPAPQQAGPRPRSFAEAAKANKSAQPPKRPQQPAAAPVVDSSAQGLAAALQQMQQMCSAMSAFLASMPGIMRG